MGVLAQGEMPNSWNPYLGLMDPSGAVSHTPDPVLGSVKGYIGIPSGQHGVVYSFPKGADRFPNGDSSSTADTITGSAGYGSPPYSFPRSGFGGLAQQGCLDMEPSVFDKMQFGFILHISQVNQISKAVGCGDSGSDSLGSIVLHADGGDSGFDSLGHEREEFRSAFNMGAQLRCLGFEPSVFNKLRIGVSVFPKEAWFSRRRWWSYFWYWVSNFHVVGDGSGCGSRDHGGEEFAFSVVGLSNDFSSCCFLLRQGEGFHLLFRCP